jgi:hypothetical protein
VPATTPPPTPASEPFRPPSPSSPPRSSGLGTVLPIVAIILALVAAGIGAAALLTKTSSSSSSPSVGPVGAIADSNYTAVVYANGTLDFGNQANYSTQTGTGLYTVTFLVILDGCSYSAAIATPAFYSTGPGVIKAQGPSTPGYNVTVIITNITTGAPLNSSFHLVAVCPGGYYAAVSENGSFAGGANVEQTGQYYTGNYFVVFDQYLFGCVYMGGTGLSYSGSAPGGVSLAALGANPDGVYVETWNSAANFTNSSFHIEVYC